MVYKCKACGAALEYSAELNKMVCTYCENAYDINEVSAGTESVSDDSELNNMSMVHGYSSMYSGTNEYILKDDYTGEPSKNSGVNVVNHETGLDSAGTAFRPVGSSAGVNAGGTNFHPVGSSAGINAGGTNIHPMGSATGANNTAEKTMQFIKNPFAPGNFNTFASDEVGDYNTILKRKQEEAAKEESRKHASIKMQIMRCTSCGAELAVNGVETSTFCAYCGQATVVQDRVEDYLKPDYIIPFKVNREDAEKIIRNQLNSGFFVPKGIKNFEVEKMRGIYIPFWLFDMYYHDKQFYKYSKKQGKTSVTRYEYIEGETNFRNLTMDASKNLNDDSSSRLEPYDMRQLKEFDMAYLAGYYSDRFDVGSDDIAPVAMNKARRLYNSEVVKELNHKSGKLVSSVPDYRIDERRYALLPAWFLSFRYDNKPYTILVNGQTGKMVGAVPFVKGKVIAVFAGMATVLIFLCVVLCMALSLYFFVKVGFDEKITFMYAIGLPIGIGIIVKMAISSYNAMVKSLRLTTSNQINKFAKERQDK